MSNNHRNAFILALLMIAFFAISQVSGSEAKANILNNNETAQSGGETDEMMESDSDLSEMETDDGNFASVENNNDVEQKQLLELEKQKQELELENQKIKY